MTTTRKLNVAVLFGGRSAEHEVSLRSAKNVVDALDKTKFNPILIGIDKSGKWLSGDSSQTLLQASGKSALEMDSLQESVALVAQNKAEITNFTNPANNQAIDVVFPVLHGPYGEDGTMQGLLKLANVPFVGPGVLGSAVGMDKDVMKRLLRDAGVPVAKFLVVRDTEKISFADVVAQLGETVVVKPANMGSSVGVSKVSDQAAFDIAVAESFRFDRKILIEECIIGREIECSVLGNDEPIASVPGEIVSDFYSYDAKYSASSEAKIEIPAKLDPETQVNIQAMAVRTFQVLCCEGMGRVDFFLRENGEILVNEINTIPGFTAISMYPQMWEASGLSYTELITKLVELAIERFEKEQRLATSY